MVQGGKLKNKILILGGSGYLGRHLFKKLGRSESLATFCNRPFDDGVYFDSVTMKLSEVIQTPEIYSHAVILLGDTNPNHCASDPIRSRLVNVTSVMSILDQLLEWGIKPIYASSEGVFDGNKGDYVETDTVRPITEYGRQKIAVEHFIEGKFDNFIILRLAKIFGSDLEDGTLFTDWINSIIKGETIYCAYDQIFAPILVDDVVEAILQTVRTDETGVFHLSSGCAYARIELLNMLIDEINKYCCIHPEVISMNINDFAVNERRPLNISMLADKFLDTFQISIRDMKSVCQMIATEIYLKRVSLDS